jgi:hypothetical protein
LAGNLEKPLMSLNMTEWRERGYIWTPISEESSQTGLQTSYVPPLGFQYCGLRKNWTKIDFFRWAHEFVSYLGSALAQTGRQSEECTK